MKSNKVLKTVTLILMILLICLVSFVGIYVKKLNYMENVVKEYNLGSNLEGVRLVKLSVNEETEEVIKDKEGKEVADASDLTDEELKEKEYTKETKPVNSEEVKTSENYKKAGEIVEKRLKDLNVTDYTVKVQETTGDITIELEENSDVDNVISCLTQQANFEVTNENGDILMDNSHLKSSKVMYSSDTDGTIVYLTIEFNKEGTKKLEEISKEYVITTDAEGNETEKKVIFKIDGQTLIESSFDTPITNGTLQLSIGNASTNSESIQSYVRQATQMVAVLNNGEMLVNYQIGENKFVYSDITSEILKNIIFGTLVVVAIGLIYLVIRYKLTGLLTSISYIGMFATLLLILRYTNVVLTIEGVVAIGVVLVLNYFLNLIILSKINKVKLEESNIKNEFKEAFISFLLNIIPICIICIVFCFINWVPIISFGMVMFWGIVIMLIYNIIITRTLLLTRAKN